MKQKFLIRQARSRDLNDLFRLARHLDSYNLPANHRRLARLISDSQKSFSRQPLLLARRRYVFVLEDLSRGRVVGCSMVVAKHGTPGFPHFYLASFVERRRSRTLQKTVDHRCFRLGETEDGPTELAGLVLLPAYRRRSEGLGAWLSHVRFLFMAAHPESFQKNLLAEFLPAFSKKRESLFWEYFGKRFTGLSYREADRLSIDNKEFIASLFPRGTIYQDFFPKEVVRHLGRVGAPTLPAARMLQKIGFRYLHQIEPFDGGPYYGAKRTSVTIIRQARRVRCHIAPPSTTDREFLLMAEPSGGLRAFVARGRLLSHTMFFSAKTATLFSLREADPLWVMPFRRS